MASEKPKKLECWPESWFFDRTRISECGIPQVLTGRPGWSDLIHKDANGEPVVDLAVPRRAMQHVAREICMGLCFLCNGGLPYDASKHRHVAKDGVVMAVCTAWWVRDKLSATCRQSVDDATGDQR